MSLWRAASAGGCDYGLCFAWRGIDVVFAEGKPKWAGLGRDLEVQSVG